MMKEGFLEACKTRRIIFKLVPVLKSDEYDLTFSQVNTVEGAMVCSIAKNNFPTNVGVIGGDIYKKLQVSEP